MKTFISLTIVAISMACATGTQAMASEFNNSVRYACSIANDTYVRDYPTLKPVAKLNRGECMDVIYDRAEGSPVSLVVYKGQTYYLVRGVSGNIRAVSARYTELK